MKKDGVLSFTIADVTLGEVKIVNERPENYREKLEKIKSIGLDDLRSKNLVRETFVRDFLGDSSTEIFEYLRAIGAPIDELVARLPTQSEWNKLVNVKPAKPDLSTPEGLAAEEALLKKEIPF